MSMKQSLVGEEAEPRGPAARAAASRCISVAGWKHLFLLLPKNCLFVLTITPPDGSRSIS